MNKLSVRDLDLQGKRVFMRVDFNVPVKNGVVKDALRIRATVPTIRLALEKGARLILASHLGRPKGGPSEELSLAPVAKVLETELGRPVIFVRDCIGPEVQNAVAALTPGQVLLLENLRFYPQEEANDPEFSRQLAALADVYVNDAFGTAHRAHASTEGMTRFLAVRAAGLLMEAEIHYLGLALENPGRPFVAILGGAKVSDKIELIHNLLGKVNILLIGGGMAYTFLKAAGLPVGDSLVEEEKLGLAAELITAARAKGVELVLPADHLIASEVSPEAPSRIAGAREGIPDGWKGVDIGPATITLFSSKLAGAKTVVWNGPLGVFEIEPFAAGTMALAKAIVESGAVSIIGGGDSAAAAQKSGVAGRFSHISTGGGASLEFLEGKVLPGVAALSPRHKPAGLA